MTTAAIHVLLPDSRLVPNARSMIRTVKTFLHVVRTLQEEINITDCKVYTSPRLLGHRHEFTTVTTNVHG